MQKAQYYQTKKHNEELENTIMEKVMKFLIDSLEKL